MRAVSSFTVLARRPLAGDPCSLHDTRIVSNSRQQVDRMLRQIRSRILLPRFDSKRASPFSKKWATLRCRILYNVHHESSAQSSIELATTSHFRDHAFKNRKLTISQALLSYYVRNSTSPRLPLIICQPVKPSLVSFPALPSVIPSAHINLLQKENSGLTF